MATLNIEERDTVILTAGKHMSGMDIRYLSDKIEDLFRGQDITVVTLPHDVSIDLIKSSNLEDNTDIEFRKNNPALQDAWEKYQVMLQLTRGSE